MKIIGADPGYDRLGVAVLESGRQPQVIYSTCLQTPKGEFAPRLVKLGEEFQKILTAHQPDYLAIEKLFFMSNQKTAGRVSEVRGLIIYLAAKAGLKVAECAPTEIKLSITGYGRADKKQVAAMLEKLVKLPARRRHDDEYDAIAVALTVASQNLIHRLGRD
jgi:crossover junction endodeoxyribonuclease RuvC